jgi:hypothetical protein
LKSVTIAPVNITGVLEYATNYTVKFTTANPLSITTTPSIKLTFDSTTFGFQVGTRTCLVEGLITGYLCTSDSSTNTITISNFLNAAVSSGRSFSFVIYNLYLRNPPTSKASPAIKLSTLQNGAEVDSDSSITLSPTTSIIPTVIVTATSYETNAVDVTYIFSMEIPGFLLTTTYIEV